MPNLKNENCMKRKVACIIMISQILMSCASLETQGRIDKSKENIESMLTFERSYIDYNLINKNGLSKFEIDKKEQDAFSKILPTCINDFNKSVGKIISDLSENLNLYGSPYFEPGKSFALKARYDVYNRERMLLECAQNFGVTAISKVELSDGRSMELSSLMSEIIGHTGEYVASVQQGEVEKQNNRQIAGSVLLGVLAAGASASEQTNSYKGNCYYPWHSAIDGDNCGDQAAAVKPGGD